MTVGLIRDLIQHNQISDERGRTESLEQRVTHLENQLARTNETLLRFLRALESRFGDGLDGDGCIG